MKVTKSQIRQIIQEETVLLREEFLRESDIKELEDLRLHLIKTRDYAKELALTDKHALSEDLLWGVAGHIEEALRLFDSLPLGEGKSASKTVGDPPYRERGSTESQAQQKAAGAAYGCRKKRGNERDECAAKLKKGGGAAYDLYSGEITFKELRNLATLGQKVKQHKSKEPKHLKSLPGHATPATD